MKMQFIRWLIFHQLQLVYNDYPQYSPSISYPKQSISYHWRENILLSRNFFVPSQYNNKDRRIWIYWSSRNGSKTKRVAEHTLSHTESRKVSSALSVVAFITTGRRTEASGSARTAVTERLWLLVRLCTARSCRCSTSSSLFIFWLLLRRRSLPLSYSVS